MGFVRSVMVGVGWTICAVHCASLHGQSPAALAPGQPRLHVPSAGQLSDGPSIYVAPSSTTEGVLQEMASRAAVIFTGTVIGVKQGTEEELRGNAATSVVEVDFVVDHAVRGVSDGATYAMREWAGLWRDSPRFVPGQRVLALLHGAGPSGLSSPVDGLDGMIPIKATGSPAETSLAGLASSAGTMQEDTVDMRWLQAKTLRVQTFSDAPTAAPGETVVGLASPQTPGMLGASGSTTAAPTSTSAGLSHVLGLLMALQETRNASH